MAGSLAEDLERLNVAAARMAESAKRAVEVLDEYLGMLTPEERAQFDAEVRRLDAEE